MDKEKFAALLPVIVGGLVSMIAEENKLHENDAFESLYNSELYAILEKEATKVWTFSVLTLFDLYQAEKITGKLDLPVY